MDGVERFTGSCRSAVIAVAVLAASCGYLGWRNHILQEQTRTLTEQMKRMSPSKGPSVGATVSLLRGQTISGEGVTFDLAHRKDSTLLLVLSPVCGYCRVNFHNWRSLLPKVRPEQVVWADVTGTADADYLASVGIQADASVIRMDRETLTQYHLTSTPITVLLGPNGTVRWAWSGAMKEEQVNDLQALLESRASVTR
jgi:hypothetical protein